jgi:hypothetical protein
VEEAMRFDIYGRFQVEVVRDDGRWVAYRVALGKRSKIDDFAIPDHLSAHEISGYLDAFYHELAQYGQRVVEI